MAVIEFKEYKGVRIFKDTNVFGRNVYIGNGQNCGTFWFSTVEEARKFIDYYEKRIKPNEPHLGLIPDEMCNRCQNRYSRFSKEYEKFPPFACSEHKEKMIAKALKLPVEIFD